MASVSGLFWTCGSTSVSWRPLEDLADLRAADEALQAIAYGEEELLPLDEAIREMELH
jgi:hypothetical protein